MLDEESLIRALERAGEHLPEGLVADTPLEVAIRREEYAEGLQWYLPLLVAEPCFPSELVPPGTLLTVWEAEECRQVLSALQERGQQTWGRLPGRHGWLAPDRVLDGPSALDTLRARLPGLDISVVAQGGTPAEGLRVQAYGTPPVAGDFDRLREQIRLWNDQGIKPVILVEDPGQHHRLLDLLGDQEGTPELVDGQLAAGFVWPEAGLALWPDHEIFRRPRRRRASAAAGGTPLRSWRALTPGDLVVHVDHGIGQYRGLRSLEVDGKETELLELHYARRDRLLVPIDQMDRVQRYVGGDEESPPALHALGGASWERAKQRARRDLMEMARDLARLYAARQTVEGTAYPADDILMEELEACFPYTETPDQIRAVEEVKRDLESPRPMDRLICGDVGYGKTEVAIRAALKVIEGGAQVAVLVPTTLLAQQHLETFRERLGRFPLRIEMLSRFRSPAQQRVILEGVARGEVDLVIGTHRLLSRDVRFARLGLVVLDEEHRFGVKAKEALRRLRMQADILSLTATPIPRTLHMSLLGLRDLSTIITPPHDRLPVHTEVVTFEEGLIAEAIRREIDRAGQVFFVHNRVRSITSIQRLLARLVPEARLGIAHGQMRGRALERIMLDFSAGHLDVLIASMIVESGLDLPHANTLIVNRADRLGLAQLYQLRGRVGRSSQKAYAYFLVPPGRRLSRDARRRLQAIQEYADLGAGLHLALRDLEIRGAGNLLGAQQHGHIAAVGLDLYQQLLDEAVAQIQGTPTPGWHPPTLEIPAPAYLPEGYVPSTGIRVSFYRRAVEARSLEEVGELYRELRDRFGPLPDPALALIDAAVLRVAGAELGLDSVVVKDHALEGRYPHDRRLDRSAWEQLLVQLGPDVRFAGEQPLRFSLALKSREPFAQVQEARNRLLTKRERPTLAPSFTTQAQGRQRLMCNPTAACRQGGGPLTLLLIAGVLIADAPARTSHTCWPGLMGMRSPWPAFNSSTR
jgi:transcription-repair coupling factor (superfamily II helicase)